MNLQNRMYPYPVISTESDDYINSKFEAEIDVEQGINDITLNIKIVLENNDILKYIDDRKIEYIVHIECTNTYYRKCENTSKKNITIKIPQDKLLNKVVICTAIIAKEKIENFTSKSFNKDYDGIVFEIPRGRVLGFSEQYELEIIKNKLESEGQPSIFSVIKNNKENEPISFDICNDKIKIVLDEQDFNNYNKINNRNYLPQALSYVVALPALIYTFEQLIQNGSTEDFEEYTWYRSINNLLEKIGKSLTPDYIREKTSIVLAQKILNLPMKQIFLGMLENMEGEENSEN